MAGGGQGAGAPNLAQIQQNLTGGMNTQSGYNNFASPNLNYMQYPQQGQANQPPPQPQNPQFSPLTGQPPTTTLQGGPDVTGSSPASNMGFDGSGSDAGVGGQPVNQMQSPVQYQGNKPPSMAQFQQPQGLQIQGNPTSQVVGKPQQR